MSRRRTSHLPGSGPPGGLPATALRVARRQRWVRRRDAAAAAINRMTRLVRERRVTHAKLHDALLSSCHTLREADEIFEPGVSEAADLRALCSGEWPSSPLVPHRLRDPDAFAKFMLQTELKVLLEAGLTDAAALELLSEVEPVREVLIARDGVIDLTEARTQLRELATGVCGLAAAPRPPQVWRKTAFEALQALGGLSIVAANFAKVAPRDELRPAITIGMAYLARGAAARVGASAVRRVARAGQ